MALQAFISFEPENIRVIIAKGKKKGKPALERALTLSIEEFNDFLKRDRSHDYKIIINSDDAIFDTITIPPVAPKLLTKLVLNELRRAFADQPPFTTAFRTVDTVLIENRPMLKIACCMISDNLLESVLEPFARYNKQVSGILSTPVLLARFAEKEMEEVKRTVLCVYDSGTRKTIFLMEKGCAILVRHVPSEGFGWDDIDLQNITMTEAYCYQALRVKPQKTIALNGGNLPESLKGFNSKLDMTYPDLYKEYLPLLAAMEQTFLDSEDLRPKTYRAEYANQNLLRRSVRFFAGAAFIVTVMLLCVLYSIISLNSSIELFRRQEQAIPAVLSDYQAIRKEYGELEQKFAIITKFNSEPSIPALLARFPETRNEAVQVLSLNALKKDDSITLTITGQIKETGFTAMQTRFENFTKTIETIEGINITEKHLDITGKNFSIVAASKQ